MAFIFDGQTIDGFSAARRVVYGSKIDSVEMDWISRRYMLLLGGLQARTTISVILHAFNFPNFRASRAVQFDRCSFGALMVLESEHWRICIQGLPHDGTNKAWEKIKREGGCQLTHVAKLERKDGKCFTGDEFEAQYEMLDNFFSFIRGRNYTLVCCIGLDEKGNTTWRSYHPPASDGEVCTWFDPECGHQAEVLFPLFAKRWQQSQEWKDSLKSAVYLYTQVNTDGSRPSIDSAIILAQAALERLAHHYLVIDKKASPNSKEKRASKLLWNFFSSLNIPIEIGAATPEIQRAASSFKWEDAPHAITDIRNELVHPVNRKVVTDCLFDAWRLSQWYLELSVLALCGYNGTYANSLTGGAAGLEKVPWGEKV